MLLNQGSWLGVEEMGLLIVGKPANFSISFAQNFLINWGLRKESPTTKFISINLQVQLWNGDMGDIGFE
jgi:hypothetical protein